MKTYKIHLQNDSLTFSSAHFITFSDGNCEALHGHDFRVSVELESELDPVGKYVVDFTRLQHAVREILRELDHKVLLPGESPLLELSVIQKEPEISPDIQGWVSTVGKWLTEVNDYQGDTSEILQERERELEHYLDEELSADAVSLSAGILRAEVEIRHENRRWIFPAEDCVILPLENTTAELLADYFLEKLRKHPLLADRPPRFLRITLEESAGTAGVCEWIIDN